MEQPKFALLLSGEMQSGKDASADILVSKAGYKRFALADPLRQVALALWTSMEAMFGLQPRTPLSFASLSSQESKNAPYLYRAELVTTQEFKADPCADCLCHAKTKSEARTAMFCIQPEHTRCSPCACGPQHTRFELVRARNPGETMLMPLSSLSVSSSVSVSDSVSMSDAADISTPQQVQVTRAAFIAFFSTVMRDITHQEFDAEKTESTAVQLFDAFARMAQRQGEAVTALPSSPDAPCVCAVPLAEDSACYQHVGSMNVALCNDSQTNFFASWTARSHPPNIASAELSDSALASASATRTVASTDSTDCLEAIAPLANVLGSTTTAVAPVSTVPSTSAIPSEAEEMDGYYWITPQFADQPLTPRWILQWLGTNLCRTNLNDQIWIQAAILGIRASQEPRIVVTDVRFPNEAELLPLLLQNAGDTANLHAFHTFRLRIEDPHKAPRDLASLHSTEQFISSLPMDAVLKNDKSLGFDALASSLAHILRGVGFPCNSVA